jgi:hypothetical protein
MEILQHILILIVTNECAPKANTQKGINQLRKRKSRFMTGERKSERERERLRLRETETERECDE